MSAHWVDRSGPPYPGGCTAAHRMHHDATGRGVSGRGMRRDPPLLGVALRLTLRPRNGADGFRRALVHDATRLLPPISTTTIP
jgi:hypothetical protein